MPTEAQMRRRIERTRDLQSVVTTMKALAAVSIRQYEAAARALDDFDRTVHLAIQAVLRRHALPSHLVTRQEGNPVAVILGSDQGMCGRFNEDIHAHALEALGRDYPLDRWTVLAVGERVAALCHNDAWRVVKVFRVPASVRLIVSRVQDVLLTINREAPLANVTLAYNRHTSSAAYEPSVRRIYPLDRPWLEQFTRQPWPTGQIPCHTMPLSDLLADLVRQYLLTSLHRAMAHSLAAENASRLSSMQAAEKNIDERIHELTNAYHRERQGTITEELLDIISGFTVLTER